MTSLRDLLSHLKTEEEIMFCAQQQEVLGLGTGRHLSPVLLLLFRTFLSHPCHTASCFTACWSWGIPVITECVCCQQQPWTAYHTLTNTQHWADAELCKVPIYLRWNRLCKTHVTALLNNLFQDNVVCVLCMCMFAYAIVKIVIFY